jgi:type IV pilus assembly protein PilP
MKQALILLSCSMLFGCSSEPNQDLKDWVAKSGNELPRSIEALPEVKAYEPFVYVADELTEPFKPRKIAEKQKADAENKGPDLNRRKELLESYPLDKLKFVGTLEQNKANYALIRADSTVHRVKLGNYLGQNFGHIITINETELQLKESIQDSEGTWKESEATLQLIDEQEKK